MELEQTNFYSIVVTAARDLCVLLCTCCYSADSQQLLLVVIVVRLSYIGRMFGMLVRSNAKQLHVGYSCGLTAATLTEGLPSVDV